MYGMRVRCLSEGLITRHIVAWVSRLRSGIPMQRWGNATETWAERETLGLLRMINLANRNYSALPLMVTGAGGSVAGSATRTLIKFLLHVIQRQNCPREMRNCLALWSLWCPEKKSGFSFVWACITLFLEMLLITRWHHTAWRWTNTANHIWSTSAVRATRGCK